MKGFLKAIFSAGVFAMHALMFVALCRIDRSSIGWYIVLFGILAVSFGTSGFAFEYLYERAKDEEDDDEEDDDKEDNE